VFDCGGVRLDGAAEADNRDGSATVRDTLRTVPVVARPTKRQKKPFGKLEQLCGPCNALIS